MKKLILIPLITSGISFIFVFLASTNANALITPSTCKPFEAIFARGSGSKVDSPTGEAVYFIDTLYSRIPNPEKYVDFYELGSEKQGQYQYPAVAISNLSALNALGASISAGYYFNYGDSVKQGVGELQTYLKERHAKCKNTTKWILGGYSQGAQVIGQTLSTLPVEIRNDILHVSLFGDPKLHLPEGEGWNPPACRSKVHFSPWRRDIANCNLDNGSLVARQPFLPNDMKYKTGLWCNTGDPICGDIVLGNDSHGAYREKGGAIDKAVREVSVLIDRHLRDETRPEPNQDPDPEPVELVDTSMPEPDTKPYELAFVLNTSYAMRGYTTAESKKEIAEMGRSFLDALKIYGQSGRIALIEYRDSDSAYPVKILTDLTSDGAQFEQAVQKLDYERKQSDEPEGALHAYMTAMKQLSWSGSGKSYKGIILNSRASFHEPDRTDGSTIRNVIQQTYKLGGVELMAATAKEHREKYRQITDVTGGGTGELLARELPPDVAEFMPSAPQMSARSVTAEPGQLVASFSSGTYSAKPGETIVFDASSSYVNNSHITSYEWDVTGDGIPDYESTEPFIEHAYDRPFSGMIRVQVRGEYGQTANAFAQVDVSDRTPQPLPATPTNLTSRITQTTNNKSTVELTWSANDANVERWILTMNNDAVGYLTKDRRKIIITDVERAEAVSFGIVGQNSDEMRGQFTETSLPAAASGSIPGTDTPQNPDEPDPQTPPTTPPVTPPKNPCTQTNILLRNICEAAERLKVQLVSALSKLYLVIGVR